MVNMGIVIALSKFESQILSYKQDTQFEMLFCISNVDDPPKELMKRDKGIYTQYIPTPLPDQLIIFGLGIWPSQVGELEVEIALTYKDENLVWECLQNKQGPFVGRRIVGISPAS